MKKVKTITLLYSLAQNIAQEADTDTEKSALEIKEELSKHYMVDLLGIFPDQLDQVAAIKTDAVFNLIEWVGVNLDAACRVIETLKKNNIPFTGSDTYGYRASSDKVLMKQLMKEHDIPTPDSMVFLTGDETIPDFSYPMIVKPGAQHCGIGVSQESLARDPEELRAKAQKLIMEFHEPIIAEEFIDGREFHVTILEKNGHPWVLPPAEVVFKKEEGFAPILSYDGKWTEDSEEYAKSSMVLPTLTPDEQLRFQKLAEKAYLKLGGADYSRLDTRVRGNNIYVLEINNNPGIDYSNESGFGLSGKTTGFSFDEILSHIVENAVYRFRKGAYDPATV